MALPCSTIMSGIQVTYSHPVSLGSLAVKISRGFFLIAAIYLSSHLSVHAFSLLTAVTVVVLSHGSGFSRP